MNKLLYLPHKPEAAQDPVEYTNTNTTFNGLIPFPAGVDTLH